MKEIGHNLNFEEELKNKKETIFNKSFFSFFEFSSLNKISSLTLSHKNSLNQSFLTLDVKKVVILSLYLIYL